VRVCDLNQIIADENQLVSKNECNKGIVAIFNEYKIVLEASFFDHSIPFRVILILFLVKLFLI